jgi:hypothetical protein
VKLSNKIKTIPTGSLFGKWTVLDYAGEKGKGKNTYWRCKCACGNIKEVSGSLLRTGKSTQCQICSGKINGRIGLDRMAKRHLYVVYSGPYFKIGSSDNPERRIKDLQASCPYPIITFIIKYGSGHLEPILHSIFKEYHHQGEWFRSGVCEL